MKIANNIAVRIRPGFKRFHAIHKNQGILRCMIIFPVADDIAASAANIGKKKTLISAALNMIFFPDFLISGELKAVQQSAGIRCFGSSIDAGIIRKVPDQPVDFHKTSKNDKK